VPIDNYHMMFFRLRWSYDPIPQEELNEYKMGDYYYPRLIPGTFTTEAKAEATRSGAPPIDLIRRLPAVRFAQEVRPRHAPAPVWWRRSRWTRPSSPR
jgi:hypothetical protein